MPGFDMKDYVPVNERIDQFYRSHPEGSIQSEIVELTATRVTVKAYAYRTPDDPRPGIGHSSLDIPGSTPYTRGSEIENCETSAWGRAIAALGFEVKRGIASREEVSNKQPGPNGKASGGATPNARSAPARHRHEELVALMKANNLDVPSVERVADRIGIPSSERPMSPASMDRLIAAIEQPEDGVPTDSGERESVARADSHTASVPVSPAGADADLLDAAVALAEAPTPKAGRTIEEAIADAEKRAKTPKVPA